MRFSVSTVVAFLGVVSAAPLTSVDAPPLPHGMPNPSPDQLAKIQDNARGTLPNTPPPATIGQNGITNLQLIAFNELFEVSFFNELLLNVTNNVDGYHLEDAHDREFVITTLTAILAVCTILVPCISFEDGG